MTLRHHIRLTTVALATVALATSACTSGTTGEPAASSSGASAASTSAFPSESVPPGVEKDPVLDLNATKDMTGVVTTVPIDKSPYLDHLPDICTFIPGTAMQKLGVTTKKRGFRGTQLVSQACNMQHLDNGTPEYSETVNLFINNVVEITDPTRTITVSPSQKLTERIVGSTIKLRSSDPNDENLRLECGTVWGTFFGSIVVNYRLDPAQLGAAEPCAASLEAARAVVKFMPKSPSEMRAAP